MQKSAESDDFDDGLTVEQHKAIIAMLSEPSLARVADAAGVGDRVIYKWLKDPAFRREMFRARRQAFDQAMSLTQRAAPAAVSTLVKIMSDEKIRPATRVMAAAKILDYGHHGIELTDLVERLDELEQSHAKHKAAMNCRRSISALYEESPEL